MKLNDYIEEEERILPVFLLVDTSGSMRGEKIQTVNVAVKEMLSTFREIKNSKGKINVAIITFGADGVKVEKSLSPIEDGDSFEFYADNMTPMGEAFTVLKDMINDVPYRAYSPSIILVSDGNPTDFPEYNDSTTYDEIMRWNALYELHNNGKAAEAVRVAIGIGGDVDSRILRAFINDKNIPLIKANEIETIEKFFKWVSSSISIRSVSVNPNQVKMAPANIFDTEEVDFGQ